MSHRLQIHLPLGVGGFVEMDGVRLQGVKHVSFDARPRRLTEVTLTIEADIDVTVDGILVSEAKTFRRK